MVTLTANVLIAAVGLAVDLGHMFVVKSELQAFSDAAAMAAVRDLDGTRAGIQNAHTLATQGPLGATLPNATNFGTTSVTTATDTYATTFGGTYDSYATATTSSTNTYRFVKVAASANVPIYFLRILPGVASPATVSSSATAGQRALPPNFNNGGLVPFAADAHSTTAANEFDFVRGQEYTFRWQNGTPPTTCPGDSGFNPSLAPPQHGFVDLGQGNGESNLGKAIRYGGYPNANSTPNSVGVGTSLSTPPGSRGDAVANTLADRSNQDSDQTDTTWSAYQAALAAGTANGRRIVTAPIIDPSTYAGSGSNRHGTVIGFANFLLDPAAAYQAAGPSGALCATYIGPGSPNSASTGGTNGASIYVGVLFQ
ncbi:MAG TPA: pilus assembly protein TadG-related protein [Bryobacteraceae bacterium]